MSTQQTEPKKQTGKKRKKRPVWRIVEVGRKEQEQEHSYVCMYSIGRCFSLGER
jgi:hypothetical protein